MRKRHVTIAGSLAEKYPSLVLYGDNMNQIMKGLYHNYPDFAQEFLDINEWVIIVKEKEDDEEQYLDQVMFNEAELGKYDYITLHPRIEGAFFVIPFIIAAAQMAAAAAAAVGGAIAGAGAAIGAGLSAAIGGGSFAAAAAGTAAGLGAGGVTAASVGAGLVAGIAGSGMVGSLVIAGAMYGLQQAFKPSMPRVNNPSAASGGESPSFLYNTPPNVTEAGNPIPLAYGTTRLGVTVISAGLHTRRKK
jgi:predicted phage tail protein